MSKVRFRRALLACAAIGLVATSGSARAQDYLSPNPMLNAGPSAAAAKKGKPAPATQAGPAAATRPAQAAQPGQPAQQAPARADLEKEFGDWHVQCWSKPAKICQVSQRRVNPANQAVLIWIDLTLTAQPQAPARVSIMVPLGIKVGAGLSVGAGAQRMADLPAVTCVAAGCIHAGTLSAQDLDTMRRAPAIETQVTALNGTRVSLNAATNGLSEALARTAAFLHS